MWNVDSVTTYQPSRDISQTIYPPINNHLIPRSAFLRVWPSALSDIPGIIFSVATAYHVSNPDTPQGANVLFNLVILLIAQNRAVQDVVAETMIHNHVFSVPLVKESVHHPMRDILAPFVKIGYY